MTEEEKMKHCGGCDDDFYNGKNPMGIKRCWNLKWGELVFRKEVPMNQSPPWDQKPGRFLSCYRRNGYVYVDPERTH